MSISPLVLILILIPGGVSGRRVCFSCSMASLLKLAKTVNALPVSRVAASDAFLLTRLSRGAGGGAIDYRTSHADAPLVEEGTFFLFGCCFLLFSGVGVSLDGCWLTACLFVCGSHMRGMVWCGDARFPVFEFRAKSLLATSARAVPTQFCFCFPSLGYSSLTAPPILSFTFYLR